MKHTKQEITQIDISSDFGPQHGFAQLSDLYGANKPGFYRNKTVVITKAGRKVRKYDATK